jgi:hypothetical protein
VENGWDQYKLHVTAELKRMNACQRDMKNELSAIRIEIARLQAKAGMWGAVGAAIPVAIMLGVQILMP